MMHKDTDLKNGWLNQQSLVVQDDLRSMGLSPEQLSNHEHLMFLYTQALKNHQQKYIGKFKTNR